MRALDYLFVVAGYLFVIIGFTVTMAVLVRKFREK